MNRATIGDWTANAHTVLLLEKMKTADGKRAVSVECERFEAISDRFAWLQVHGSVSSAALSQNIDPFEYFDAFDGRAPVSLRSPIGGPNKATQASSVLLC